MKISLKTLLTFGLLFAIISNSQATEITNTSATGTTFKFSATLDAPLTTGNKVKIDFGKGLKAMTCSTKTCMLSSNALPSGISTATYKVGIYDAKNVLQGSTSDGTYVITSNSSAPVSNYIKIANDGSELSDSAKLGSNPKDWACTKENKTGLIWEVKTIDGGLRDASKTYTNFTADYPECNWAGCAKDNPGKYGDTTNTNGYVEAVNRQKLCSASNWQIPTREELDGLKYCSDGKYNADGSCTNYRTINVPLINLIYFPNTQNDTFWSSSPNANYSSNAWYFDFGNGYSSNYAKSNFSHVRLVRNSK